MFDLMNREGCNSVYLLRQAQGLGRGSGEPPTPSLRTTKGDQAGAGLPAFSIVRSIERGECPLVAVTDRLYAYETHASVARLSRRSVALSP
jgi:hypothetical protein